MRYLLLFLFCSPCYAALVTFGGNGQVLNGHDLHLTGLSDDGLTVYFDNLSLGISQSWTERGGVVEDLPFVHQLRLTSDDGRTRVDTFRDPEPPFRQIGRVNGEPIPDFTRMTGITGNGRFVYGADSKHGRVTDLQTGATYELSFGHIPWDASDSGSVFTMGDFFSSYGIWDGQRVLPNNDYLRLHNVPVDPFGFGIAVGPSYVSDDGHHFAVDGYAHMNDLGENHIYFYYAVAAPEPATYLIVLLGLLFTLRMSSRFRRSHLYASRG